MEIPLEWIFYSRLPKTTQDWVIQWPFDVKKDLGWITEYTSCLLPFETVYDVETKQKHKPTTDLFSHNNNLHNLATNSVLEPMINTFKAFMKDWVINNVLHQCCNQKAVRMLSERQT